MSSVHKSSRLLVSLALAMLAGGCTLMQNSPPELLNPNPIAQDEAMKIRDWDQSVAVYPNGGAAAESTGFLFAPDPKYTGCPAAAVVIETSMFVGQTVAWPLMWTLDKGWDDRVYKGASVPETYTAATPLP